MIETAEVRYDPQGGGRTAPELLVMAAWPHGKAPFRMPEGLAARVSTMAEVNHSRWIVRCPFCPGAQLASDVDHRMFCVDCLHEGTAAEDRWIRVVWPDGRSAAEEHLERRPDPRTRNFDPRSETVKDLIRENKQLLKQLEGVV